MIDSSSLERIQRQQKSVDKKYLGGSNDKGSSSSGNGSTPSVNENGLKAQRGDIVKFDKVQARKDKEKRI